MFTSPFISLEFMDFTLGKPFWWPTSLDFFGASPLSSAISGAMLGYGSFTQSMLGANLPTLRVQTILGPPKWLFWRALEGAGVGVHWRGHDP